MERFATLRLIMRFGAIGSVGLALLSAVTVTALLWNAMGWPAVPVALVASGLVYLLAKSYVEIISLVMELAH